VFATSPALAGTVTIFGENNRALKWGAGADSWMLSAGSYLNPGGTTSYTAGVGYNSAGGSVSEPSFGMTWESRFAPVNGEVDTEWFLHWAAPGTSSQFRAIQVNTSWGANGKSAGYTTLMFGAQRILAGPLGGNFDLTIDYTVAPYVLDFNGTVKANKFAGRATADVVLAVDTGTALTINWLSKSVLIASTQSTGGVGGGALGVGANIGLSGNAGGPSYFGGDVNVAGLVLGGAGAHVFGNAAANSSLTVSRTTTNPSSVILSAVTAQPALAFTSDTGGGYTHARVVVNGSEVLRFFNNNLGPLTNIGNAAGIAIGGGVRVASTEEASASAGSILAAGGISAAKKIITASTLTTASNVAWDFGAYSVGAPTPDGYLTVVVAGTTYRISADAQP
jgi:hypothetical protein